MGLANRVPVLVLIFGFSWFFVPPLKGIGHEHGEYTKYAHYIKDINWRLLILYSSSLVNIVYEKLALYINLMSYLSGLCPISAPNNKYG